MMKAALLSTEVSADSRFSSVATMVCQIELSILSVLEHGSLKEVATGNIHLPEVVVKP